MDAVGNLNKTTALIIEAIQKEGILNQLQNDGRPNLRWNIYTLDNVFGKKQNSISYYGIFDIFVLHY